MRLRHGVLRWRALMQQVGAPTGRRDRSHLNWGGVLLWLRGGVTRRSISFRAIRFVYAKHDLRRECCWVRSMTASKS